MCPMEHCISGFVVKSSLLRHLKRCHFIEHHPEALKKIRSMIDINIDTENFEQPRPSDDKLLRALKAKVDMAKLEIMARQAGYTGPRPASLPPLTKEEELKELIDKRHAKQLEKEGENGKNDE